MNDRLSDNNAIPHYILPSQVVLNTTLHGVKYKVLETFSMLTEYFTLGRA